MRNRWMVGALGLLWGCGGATADVRTSEAPRAEVSADPVADERTNNGPSVDDAVAHGPTPAAVLRLGETREAVAGGPVDAHTLGEGCVGWIPAEPQLVIELASVQDLVITVASDLDATMSIVSPSGAARCNDDSIGLNPRIEATFEAGVHRVYVGTFDAGSGGAFRATASSPERHERISGIPLDCGLATAELGVIRLGMPVILGSHSGWTGNDGRGGMVVGDTWWNDRMWPFVGREAHVTEGGLDPIGCPYVRVDIDGGSWGWRIRDLRPAPDTQSWLESVGRLAPLPPIMSP
jgi:hypothetical protein